MPLGTSSEELLFQPTTQNGCPDKAGTRDESPAPSTAQLYAETQKFTQDGNFPSCVNRCFFSHRATEVDAPTLHNNELWGTESFAEQTKQHTHNQAAHDQPTSITTTEHHQTPAHTCDNKNHSARHVSDEELLFQPITVSEINNGDDSMALNYHCTLHESPTPCTNNKLSGAVTTNTHHLAPAHTCSDNYDDKHDGNWSNNNDKLVTAHSTPTPGTAHGCPDKAGTRDESPAPSTAQLYAETQKFTQDGNFPSCVNRCFFSHRATEVDAPTLHNNELWGTESFAEQTKQHTHNQAAHDQPTSITTTEHHQTPAHTCDNKNHSARHVSDEELLFQPITVSEINNGDDSMALNYHCTLHESPTPCTNNKLSGAVTTNTHHLAPAHTCSDNYDDKHDGNWSNNNDKLVTSTHPSPLNPLAPTTTTVQGQPSSHQCGNTNANAEWKSDEELLFQPITRVNINDGGTQYDNNEDQSAPTSTQMEREHVATINQPTAQPQSTSNKHTKREAPTENHPTQHQPVTNTTITHMSTTALHQAPAHTQSTTTWFTGWEAPVLHNNEPWGAESEVEPQHHQQCTTSTGTQLHNTPMATQPHQSNAAQGTKKNTHTAQQPESTIANLHRYIDT